MKSITTSMTSNQNKQAARVCKEKTRRKVNNLNENASACAQRHETVNGLCDSDDSMVATTVGHQRPTQLTAEVSERLRKNFTSLIVCLYTIKVVCVCVPVCLCRGGN